MRNLALPLLAAAALAVLAPDTRAQVIRVPNTGCPSAGYPTHSGSARIGQSFSFGFTCSLASRQAFAILGLPSATGINFFAPFMCSSGPCVFYPAPIGGRYGLFPLQPASGSWTVNLPNHPGLIGSRWALQCSCYCP